MAAAPTNPNDPFYYMEFSLYRAELERNVHIAAIQRVREWAMKNEHAELAQLMHEALNPKLPSPKPRPPLSE